MQIRAQLRKQALMFARHPEEYVWTATPTSNSFVSGVRVIGRQTCCYDGTCPSGVHSRYQRIRFKSRARHHGNKTGQSKHAGKG